ncbi:MAG: metallophosphoesterase [Melioribacteraceae bacterium]|nr:metallophosphoesterase [Melioribacteraceae bacterium]
MRIAHISDLHFCFKYKRGNILKTQELIKRSVELGADHLIITGDISDNSEERDFELLARILEINGLFSSEKTSIIIGNHDIYGGVQTATDIITFPSKCLSTDFNEKVKTFYKYFGELFKNCSFLVENNPFPFVKKLGNYLILGINSIDEYSRIKNPFASNGKIHKKERKLISNFFEDVLLSEIRRIAAVHHHFYLDSDESKSSETYLWNKIENFTMKLRGKKKLIKLFLENKFECVFHGHSHEMKEYFRKGIRFINAAASVDNGTEDEAHLFLVDFFNSFSQSTIESVKIETVEEAEFIKREAIAV